MIKTTDNRFIKALKHNYSVATALADMTHPEGARMSVVEREVISTGMSMIADSIHDHMNIGDFANSVMKGRGYIMAELDSDSKFKDVVENFFREAVESLMPLQADVPLVCAEQELETIAA